MTRDGLAPSASSSFFILAMLLKSGEVRLTTLRRICLANVVAYDDCEHRGTVASRGMGMLVQGPEGYLRLDGRCQCWRVLLLCVVSVFLRCQNFNGRSVDV